MPRFAGDAIAPSKLGQVVAVAERIDTISGGFAAGLKPTGNKDPFALRRSALALARTIVEGGHHVDLIDLLRIASVYTWSAIQKRTNSEILEMLNIASKKILEVSDDPDDLPKFEDVRRLKAEEARSILDVSEKYDFIVDRLRSYYADRGAPAHQFESVVALRPQSLLDLDRRLNAIAEFAKLPEAEALAAANKRSRNILKKVEGEVPSAIDASLFNEPAERELAEAVDAAVADTDPLLAQRDYVAVLGRLARLRPQVDAFFDKVMVNVDDSAVRNNRLALLKRLSDRLGSVAAIEHLSI